MTADRGDASALAPDDAFAVLGNETRMEILQTLGAAEGALSFSDLRERVGMRDSGQFNYHLDKLAGHFVGKTDDGYELRPAGERVNEAVLSGAVSDAPVLEPTRITEPCPLCDGQTVITVSEQRVQHYCTDCDGHYGTARPPAGAESGEATAEYGALGSFQLPPAGLQDRTADEVFRAAATWGVLELLAMASDVCPRCSAPLARSVTACTDHDADDEFCATCGNRRATQVELRCRNCRHAKSGALPLALVADGDVLAFLLSHGINPVAPSAPTEYYAALMEYDEEVLSADPFEARVTLTVEGETLSLTVNDDLQVTVVE